MGERKARPESQTLLPIGATTIVGDRGLCVVIAVQWLPIHFALRFEITFSLRKARPERQVLLPIGASYELAPILAKVRIDN